MINVPIKATTGKIDIKMRLPAPKNSNCNFKFTKEKKLGELPLSHIRSRRLWNHLRYTGLQLPEV